MLAYCVKLSPVTNTLKRIQDTFITELLHTLIRVLSENEKRT